MKKIFANRCWVLHSWGKWIKYEQSITLIAKWGNDAGKTHEGVEHMQQRHCSVCGKIIQRKC